MSRSPRQSESLGRYASVVEAALGRLEADRAVQRIRAKDAALWKSEETHQEVIRNSLGWLDVARIMRERAAGELKEFAVEMRDQGFTHLMVLGMGGSSLCPEVLRRTFGHACGYPELLVLDTTDPDTIHSFEEHLDKRRTIFIVSSKSGTTIEPLSFYKYFFDRVRTLKGERAGENFVAITDPGTLMERMAREANFRRIFLNPSDIGGRYSALSYFGMVPAALMGIDVEEMLGRAVKMMDACGASVHENQAARLGAAMGALALEGRNKLTLLADPQVSSLGLWIEQLVAESTGKEGRGIVPVAGEPLGAPEVYGDDRLFVCICVGETNEETDKKVRALEEAGHPVVRRVMNDALDLGAEFFTWEFATAVAGQLMKINPFDQPNVQESKDNTNALLDKFKEQGRLPEEKALVREGALTVYGISGMEEARALSDTASLPSLLTEFLSKVKAGDYIALLAYIQETPTHDELLQAIRTHLRDRLRVATTTGYGPRFLHSTGQLHKGGLKEALFLQLTDEDHQDLPVPGEPYTFSTLKEAQAIGDFSSLAKRNRRALRIHLGSDATEGLGKLLELLRAATLSDAQSSSA
ncbi:MAG: bifunctional transaldolase/phosoglucose isomerase [Pyrinomonadaceae bacterium]|nr:bifunctional transaldolase/phosoglucose isomerase [Pyrinomonadaceae bacterium]